MPGDSQGRAERVFYAMMTTEGPSGPFALLKQIECEHAVERSFCDRLEVLADTLPAIDSAAASEAVAILRKSLRRHIALEEGLLLPMLITRAQAEDNVKALRCQVAAEHAADEVLAHDIADELDAAAGSRHVRNPEMLGFMLHGYFECRRRHLAWESAVVLPLAIRRLRESDWQILAQSALEKPLESSHAARAHAGCGCTGGKKRDG